MIDDAADVTERVGAEVAGEEPDDLRLPGRNDALTWKAECRRQVGDGADG